MNIFGLTIELAGKAATTLDINTLISRLEAVYDTASGIAVTPETAMKSPTVNAIVTAVSRRIATLPIRVLRRTTVDDNSVSRVRTEELPSHPVAKLLAAPNDFQDRIGFWLDATSWLVRYGNFYAFKSRGATGPILQLIPLPSGAVDVKQDANLAVTYTVQQDGGAPVDYLPKQIMHARTAARNGVKGDSPIADIREAIALEIAAEKMGASVFGNSAMPSMVFKFSDGAQGFKTDEERKRFIEDFQAVYAKKGRFKSMLLPKGIELGEPVGVDNEKAQFLATRQYQRTVIAGAFGVPPHLVGDLTKMTFGNVEQQSLDYVSNVVLPYARVFEAAMERSLLAPEDRNSGVIIRFDLNAAQQTDFKTRQEGLNIQRQAGVISPNDWRAAENMNPISPDDGGDDYWRKGPSGQSAESSGGDQNPSPQDQPQNPQGDQNATNS